MQNRVKRPFHGPVALGLALGGCNSSSDNSSNPGPKPTPTVAPTIAPTPTQTATATSTIAPTATPTSTPSKTGGLWVPNLFGPSVNEFDPPARAVSGNPPPQFSNESAFLLLPAGLAFDSSQNLWVSNCSDFTLGTGAIAEFTAAQLANLGNNSAPDPNTTLLDDGSFTILNCPWGAQFDAAGNLWITNRAIPNLVSYSPAQLAVGGALTPDTTITSTSFDSPRGIGFDASANLWIVENQNQQVLGYKAATLATALGHSGQVNPDIIISSSSFGDPRAIAFNSSGDLWLADATGKLLKFAAADLAAWRYFDTDGNNHRDPGGDVGRDCSESRSSRWSRLRSRWKPMGCQSRQRQRRQPRRVHAEPISEFRQPVARGVS